MGTASAAAIGFWSNDIVSEILATSPVGKVMETRFKGMADIVLGEAKLLGCSYADVRFTLTASPAGATINYRADAPDAGPGGRGGGRGAGGAAGGRGGAAGGRGGGGGGDVEVAPSCAISRPTPIVRRPDSVCESSTVASGALPQARS